MKNITLSTPKFGFIVATRAALAMGLGLMISSKLEGARRRKVGRALVALGGLATIPAAMFIVRSRRTDPA